ncbi:CoA-binding protein [Candidatus Saccharibacteria bacterium]|nr:MAG: CoA-binding protein [Candidatus Saccharibacteria bacterium]
MTQLKTVNEVESGQLDSGQILQNAKVIAVIGASNKTDRFSYKASRQLQRQGYQIIPINPNVQEILGEKAYPSLLDVPASKHIDIALIFRKSEETVSHLQELMRRDIHITAWLASGTGSPSAELFAKQNQLCLIADRCIMITDEE